MSKLGVGAAIYRAPTGFLDGPDSDDAGIRGIAVFVGVSASEMSETLLAKIAAWPNHNDSFTPASAVNEVGNRNLFPQRED
ncbi:MAG: hypothetical protein M2R45_04957 [Verrucomicrobia subdivision 3 bacterium]|nr:hypothetical protein [Limisphaerales bacterium]